VFFVCARVIGQLSYKKPALRGPRTYLFFSFFLPWVFFDEIGLPFLPQQVFSPQFSPPIFPKTLFLHCYQFNTTKSDMVSPLIPFFFFFLLKNEITPNFNQE